MSGCCEKDAEELTRFRKKHFNVLIIVLVINATMFVVESISGWLAHSTSLLADSMDMFADAFVYGITICVIGKSSQWNARISLLKGVVMSGLGIFVLAQAIQRFMSPVRPDSEVMGVVGVLALVANVTCALLILKHRNDDINMRSTLLCTRNDVIANIGVLVAAALVAVTGTQYPDLVIGSIVATMFLKSALTILKMSAATLLSN